ncbi:hypothetical protein HBI23_216060 [Parastagonospora nodorum]|nr:hypothetical protein HBI45_204970 [Parastagonospora nodorum]KAH5633474.1 hypothetical protein HBI23_216060 [Parastagonospora nodorum]KAH6260010.1 hypothetical protein HBI42_090620 [Parastagonospora nodorum]
MRHTPAAFPKTRRAFACVPPKHGPGNDYEGMIPRAESTCRHGGFMAGENLEDGSVALSVSVGVMLYRCEMIIARL